MADLGAACLWMGLALAVYSCLASVAGQLRGAPALVDSGRQAAYALVLVLLVSTLSLVQSFIAHDFSLAYVAAHSSRAMPHIYTWVAFYAGNEGSLLYIAFALSAMAALAIRLAPAATRPTLAWTVAILMFIEVFFLAVMAFMANPFQRLPFPVPDGQGINPLLTHFGMFLHPPALMAGLVGISIPMAFSLGGLIGGKGGDEWIDAGRAWGVGIWVVLASGLLLGSWWAYTILGWGGFWFWDPVENAAFMPWIALTAFVHSIMVQKRRGMFRMWNIVLIDVAFGLALYGMFMNRGGPEPSVHSFGASNLGWVFLMFLAVGVVVPLAIFFWRYNLMRSAQHLDAMLSREAAFLLNNLLLLGIAFATLWGTVYPLLYRLFAEEKITLARPYFDQVNGPLMLALVLLMGVGPLLPWRRANWQSLRRALLLPGAAALVTAAVLLIVGIRQPYAVIGFALCALVTAGIAAEWTRGVIARRRSMGDNPALGFLRLLAANRPRYGGYIVHLAVVMVALGVVGQSFYGIQRDVVLFPGESVRVENYRLDYVDTTALAFADRTEYRTTVEVYRDGEFLTTMQPHRTFHPDHDTWSTLASIRSTPVEDFYVVPSEIREDGAIGFRILVNPLVWWMWVAGPVLILGTVFALWPSRAPARRPAFAPAPAASPASGVSPASGAAD